MCIKNFTDFELDGIERVTGGRFSSGIKTIVVTNCGSENEDDGGDDKDVDQY